MVGKSPIHKSAEVNSSYKVSTSLTSSVHVNMYMHEALTQNGKTIC